MSGFADCNVDLAILERAQRGDMKAHEVLYRVYSTPVYTLAYRMLQTKALADEVLQDTSVEVIRKLHTVRDAATFPGWIKRVAVNKCLGLLRSAWHRRATALLDDGSEGPTLASLHHDDGGDVRGTEAGMDLADAMEKLGPTARSVVWLHDVEGYTHREIGELMGKTTSFSKSQLARAHERLRSWLDTADGSGSCTQPRNSY